jgi:hypothetical protein
LRATSVRTGDDYRRASDYRCSTSEGPGIVLEGQVVTLDASRPAPTEVTDGRVWGDEVWLDLFQPNNAATADAAAKVLAVHFCCSFLAEIMGSIQLEFMTDEGRRRISRSATSSLMRRTCCRPARHSGRRWNIGARWPASRLPSRW